MEHPKEDPKMLRLEQKAAREARARRAAVLREKVRSESERMRAALRAMQQQRGQLPLHDEPIGGA